jgi:hypothetical protein
MERENLAVDAKGKGASGSHREAESTDAPERGGLPRSSDEGSVMVLERRGWVATLQLASQVSKSLHVNLEPKHSSAGDEPSFHRATLVPNESIARVLQSPSARQKYLI